MPGPREILACRRLVKRRGGSGAGFELRVPELSISQGEIVVLRGVSGCGKSTLLDILALALAPDAADRFSFRPGVRSEADIRALWDGRELDRLAGLRGLHIGYVLQTGGLLSFLTAGENIQLSCRLLGRDGSDTIADLVRRLGIDGQLHKRPGQLSVGERQRVAIARALAHRPRLVLADEPTASVDPLNARAIIELFLQLVRQAGSTAIIATHDWRPEAIPGVRLLDHRLEREGEITRSLFWG